MAALFSDDRIYPIYTECPRFKDKNIVKVLKQTSFIWNANPGLHDKEFFQVFSKALSFRRYLEILGDFKEKCIEIHLLALLQAKGKVCFDFFLNLNSVIRF